jgi:RHS repeat-associated protein
LLLSGLTPQSSNGSNPYNPANNRLVSNGYEARGNMTSLGAVTMGYDAESNLTSVKDTGTSQSITWIFDAEGQRAQKWVTPIGGGSQVTTVFVHDALGQLAAEYNTAGVTPACTTCYLTYDMLGSVRMVTDQNQAVIARHDYLPFGEELPNGTAGRSGNGFDAVSNVTHGFTGQESDGGTAGLDFFNARHLSAPVGAFIQPDPMNAGADITRPQSWNAYGYVLGNPLGLVDPSGMCSPSDNTPCYSGGTTVIGATSNDPDFASSTNAYNLLNSILTNAYQFLMGGGGGGAGGGGGGANFTATGYGKADVDTVSTAAFGMLFAPPKSGTNSSTNTCSGSARVLQGNANTIGKPGGFSGPSVGTFPVTRQGAAIIPSQWAPTKSALRPYINQISGRFPQVRISFRGLVDTIGSTDIPNVQSYLMNKNPEKLIIELPGASQDYGVTNVTVIVPSALACPAGTVQVP